jgi:hypothetical protein
LRDTNSRRHFQDDNSGKHSPDFVSPPITADGLRRGRGRWRLGRSRIAGVNPHNEIAESAQQVGGQLLKLVFHSVPETGGHAIEFVQAALEAAVPPLQPGNVAKVLDPLNAFCPAGFVRKHFDSVSQYLKAEFHSSMQALPLHYRCSLIHSSGS